MSMIFLPFIILFFIIKVLYTVIRVGIGVTSNLATGLERTAQDLNEATYHLQNRDYKRLGQVVDRRIANTARGVCATLDTAGRLGYDLCKNPSDFASNRNIKRITQVATLGVAMAVPSMLPDNDACAGVDFDGASGWDAPSDAVLASSCGLSPAAVSNGFFVGNYGDLVDLARAGEIDGTVHVDSSDIVRSMGARDAFLSAHGFSGVPAGYEVHHIHPLSEGGSDTPDNMILVSEEDHNRITAMHRAYYGWRA